MTPKFYFRGLILKNLSGNWKGIERYIAIKYELAEITLKLNLSGSTSQ